LELSRGYKGDVQEVATRMQQFSPGIIEPYEVLHYREGAILLDSVGLDVHCFTRQTLLTINRWHLLVNNLCRMSFGPQKTHNSTLLF
jgi:hypothetical protein